MRRKDNHIRVITWNKLITPPLGQEYLSLEGASLGFMGDTNQSDLFQSIHISELIFNIATTMLVSMENIQ